MRFVDRCAGFTNVSHVAVNVLEYFSVFLGTRCEKRNLDSHHGRHGLQSSSYQWPVIGATDERKICRSKSRCLFEPTRIVS